MATQRKESTSPPKLDAHLLGLRIHDVNRGLVAVSSGLINTQLRQTKRVGAAAQIAGLIAGEQVVNYESLLMAAGELQLIIDDLEKGRRMLAPLFAL